MTIEELKQARRILAGHDAAGHKAFPGMFDADVISLAHGEGVRRPHPSVIAAGVAALLDRKRSSLDNYLFLRRLPCLQQVLAHEFALHGAPHAFKDNITVDASTTRLFHAFLHAVARPGDRFFTAPGHYHSLITWCRMHRVELVIVPAAAHDHYKLSAEALRRAYHADRQRLPRRRPPRGVFFFQPTYFGALYSEPELDALAACMKELGLFVLEDSIFMPTVFDRTQRPRHLIAEGRELPRAALLSGGSKAYGLANVRIGWACGERALIEAMRSYTTDTLTSVPQLAQEMALASVRAQRAYLDANAAECERRARLVARGVDALEAALQRRMRPGRALCRVDFFPQAGHSILLDFEGLRDFCMPNGVPLRSNLDLCAYLLTEAKVALSPCGASGLRGMKLRATFGCVGAEHTYPATRAQELRMVQTVVAHYAVGHADGGEDAWPQALLAAVAQDETSEAGFERGRRLLEQALLERVLPALLRLRSPRASSAGLSVGPRSTAHAGSTERPKRTLDLVVARRVRHAAVNSARPAEGARLVMFDVDGVLIDSEAISARVLATMAREHGGQVSDAEALTLLRGLSFARWEQILTERGAWLPDDFEPAFRARCENRFEVELAAFPGVRSVLENLPYPCCVASNGPQHKIRRNLARTGLLRFVEGAIFSGYDVQAFKPDPALFLHAASRLGFVPAQCVVIEDSAVGVIAAQAAGMHVLGFAPDGEAHARELDHLGCRVFDDMHTLPALLALTFGVEHCAAEPAAGPAVLPKTAAL